MQKKLYFASKQILINKDGYMLINAVLVFLVALIMIGSLSASSLYNHKQAVKHRDLSSVYYFAEGGLNEFMTYVLNDTSDVSHDDFFTYLQNTIIPLVPSESELMGHQVERVINIELLSPGEFLLTSSAQIGTSKRVVQQTIQFPCLEDKGNHDDCRLTNLTSGPIREVR